MCFTHLQKFYKAVQACLTLTHPANLGPLEVISKHNQVERWGTSAWELVWCPGIEKISSPSPSQPRQQASPDAYKTFNKPI